MAEGQPRNPMVMMNFLRGDLPPEVVREGVTHLWMVSERALQALKSYEIRDDDVWVTTYPQAGTQWAVELVNLVLVDGEVEKIDPQKQPRLPMEFDLTQPGTFIPPQFPDHMKEPMFEKGKKMPSPRVFMTHLAEHILPPQINEGKGKVVFVIRNPKDTAVSMWNFLSPIKANPKHEQWDTFFDLYCSDDIVFSSWFTFNLTFWKKHRHDKNFLFLKYEDMKRDLRGVVVKIAHFLERPLSDEAIDRVVKSSKGDTAVIGKGAVGEWKTQFTEAQKKTFDKLFNEKMEGADLHLDFEN